MRRAIFTLKMKKTALVLLTVLALVSCKNSPSYRTYEAAEKEFIESLTFKDTLAVLMLGQNFMDALVAGSIDHELSELCVVYQDTLYKIADKSILEIRSRLSSATVTDYALSGYSFSTPGINDLTYRYVTSGKVGDGPAFKITFNPVKVEEGWFLTLKDGNMASADIHSIYKRHPLSEAPEEIHLHKRQ